MDYMHQIYTRVKQKERPYWSKKESLTEGPTCQDLLLPSVRVKEREENELGQSRPLDKQLFSPSKREEKGDEGEPFDEANECRNREN